MLVVKLGLISALKRLFCFVRLSTSLDKKLNHPIESWSCLAFKLPQLLCQISSEPVKKLNHPIESWSCLASKLPLPPCQYFMNRNRRMKLPYRFFSSPNSSPEPSLSSTSVSELCSSVGSRKLNVITYKRIHKDVSMNRVAVSTSLTTFLEHCIVSNGGNYST